MLIFFALCLGIITFINSNSLQKSEANANNNNTFYSNLGFMEDIIPKNFLGNMIPNNDHNHINIFNYNITNLENKDKQTSLINEVSSISAIKSIKEAGLRLLQINFKCLNEADCSNHGSCVNSACVCNAGYTEVGSDSSAYVEDKRCYYEQKTQLRAFLYELFLGFGAGHFYTERYTHASLKLAAYIFGIIIICLFPITAKCLSEKLESDCLVLTVSCFYYLCSIGLAFWFIYDLVMFGMNNYIDGNGVKLISWNKNSTQPI